MLDPKEIAKQAAEERGVVSVFRVQESTGASLPEAMQIVRELREEGFCAERENGGFIYDVVKK